MARLVTILLLHRFDDGQAQVDVGDTVEAFLIHLLPGHTWGFPNIMGIILGVPIIRIIVFWGLYWGPLIVENYHLLAAPYGVEARVPSRGTYNSL